jgi:hypothetical protein
VQSAKLKLKAEYEAQIAAWDMFGTTVKEMIDQAKENLIMEYQPDDEEGGDED